MNEHPGNGPPRFLSKERIVAPEGFNRWLAPPASIAVHLCIGSVYAWSIFNAPLTRIEGVVVSAGGDWSLSQVVWVFTVAIVCLGLSAAFGGRWLERVGPRAVGLAAACCWGGGFLVGALGILTHQLWLLYLGYGALGGCGLGLGYVFPVSTLMRWFPDRRGMATGMAIMGFGGGAIIAAPLKEALIRAFQRAPDYLGAVSEVGLLTRDGRRFAETADGLREVVVAGARDAPQLTSPGAEGVYVVGSGDAGVLGAFLVLGVAYFAIMALAALAFRVPPPGWKPAGWEPPAAGAPRGALVSARDVHVDQAPRTPQFWLLWLVLCLNVTAGIGVLGVATTIMTEIFGSALPAIVDGTFAANYVLLIGMFNMAGRFLWSSVSDYLGRKRTYAIFFVLGVALYASIPLAAHGAGGGRAEWWLAYFCVATMLIFTMYGGGFATLPAYLADLFGTRFVGAIHGRVLTAWSVAGVIGPLAITTLRARAEDSALHDLAERTDPALFAERFGAGADQLHTLMREKTVTIPSLLEIAPPGTPDPSASLYDTTMFLMAGLLAVALIANALIRPVAERHHLEEEAAGDGGVEGADGPAAPPVR